MNCQDALPILPASGNATDVRTTVLLPLIHSLTETVTIRATVVKGCSHTGERYNKG